MPSFTQQLRLPLVGTESPSEQACGNGRERLASLLAQDLDFHDKRSDYCSHNFHSFPAKFPPQLPRRFILGLTDPGDIVLDPMVGSGTTLLEAVLAGRRALGFDIDPLALLVSNVKTTPFSAERAADAGGEVLRFARFALVGRADQLRHELETRFDPKTRRFIEYWFAPRTQLELLALVLGLERVEDSLARSFLRATLSSIVITKSGGVSLARDLGHTRPHRAEEKEPRCAISEFEKRLERNLRSLRQLDAEPGCAQVLCGDAQQLPLGPGTVDLIVTSPPYASNAIDYMRAHKFSLVWFGYPIDALSQKRRQYIGGEATQEFAFEGLSPKAGERVAAVAAADAKKGAALNRYYSEMTRCIREMFRVLRPGKVAVLVVGTSVMRGIDTLTHVCLADIAEAIGFEVIGIATRRLDRDRRMMPARNGEARASQIEHRMHEEYVIGLLKPNRVEACDARRTS